MEYKRVPELEEESCEGYINEFGDIPKFCNNRKCYKLIWIEDKEVEIDEQRDLELFIIDYLIENSEDIEKEYFRARLDDFLDNIQLELRNHPLEDEIREAIKDCIVSNGPNNIFIDAINRIDNKLR